MEAPSTGRSVDIEFGGQEIITVEFDNLDPNPEDVLELLKDGQYSIWTGAKLASEYWRRGYLPAAERIAHAVIEAFEGKGSSSSLPPIYSLLANIQIALARKAPKIILADARQDILKNEKSKEEYYRVAAQYLNQGERIASESESGSGPGVGVSLAFLTRGIQQLATRSMDDALKSFEVVLAEKPTNVVALMGKGRILYARRNYPQGLKIFQQVLQLNPSCLPDPRIGIGLCLWAMDCKARAKAAWRRSLEVNPGEWAAQLLLGLEAINSSKNEALSEELRAQNYTSGTKMVEQAFKKADQKSAAGANALCELFLRKGSFSRALKLAERTIQFADTLTVLTEGYLRAGRISHAEGSLTHATKHYASALEGQPKNVLGAIGQAQMRLLTDDTSEAIHILDALLRPPNAQKSLDATVMLASLRVHTGPGGTDAASEKTRTRELFDKVVKGLELEDGRSDGYSSRITRTIGDDLDMHIEMAKLWRGDSTDRTAKAFKEALRVSQASGKPDPRLINNSGALQHIEGNLAEARASYESALTQVSGSNIANSEAMSTTVLYNLARVYEDQGEEALAKDAFEKLLSRHPEYVDAKIRQANTLSNFSRHNEAHELIKQCLASQGNNHNLRAFYTYFLIKMNMLKPAKDFVFATLRDHDRHDVYSLCAAGWIMYQQSRENRDSSREGLEDRKKGFQRSAEFYDKALQLDPLCAVAAQGLAIVTAEDALGALLAPSMSAPEEVQKRMKNTRDALDVFAKVRESLNDGSVYCNMGHCYYARDEFDRAIESYETASSRFFGGHNVPALLCLCRTWYAKGIKDQSFAGMSTALKYAQMALHCLPNDKAIVYNMAMIQQKAAEMIFSMKPGKRTLRDLQRAIDQATQGQKIFASLASDPSELVPYNREIADQRRKYGDNMLKKSEEHLAAQRQHEGEAQAKIEAARQRRQYEKDRLEKLEHERLEVLRQGEEKLAEERRIAKLTALEWTREVKLESDEEKERKEKKTRKKKNDALDGEDEEPRKKRRTKKKEKTSDGEDNAVFSDEEDGGGPKKRVPKKRVVRDDDDEEESKAARKKQFKSVETLSDTDDEMT